MSTLVQQKVDQGVEILKELGIDLWLTFTRESNANNDPVLPLIYGHDLTWQSALMLTASGERIAILGAYEAETARRTGAYTTILPYHESIKAPLLETLERLNPAQIALNYSLNDVHADGLPYGLYQVLRGYLAGTPWGDRLISAEKIHSALRGRKTAEEIRRIRQAIEIAEEIFRHTFDYAKPGVTEKQISDFMHRQAAERGLELAWEAEHCPIVDAGPDSPVGHVGPSDIQLQPGHLLHLDFGVKWEDYCSDNQRVAYVLQPGEHEAPPEVQRAFTTVIQAIEAAVSAMRPGVRGLEVDAAARQVVVSAGYPEYKYGTGHHLGRTVHDGAGMLAPLWDRYGETPNYPLEAGNVFTVEPGIPVPGFGYIGIEEVVLVTEDGAEYLSTPQKQLFLI